MKPIAAGRQSGDHVGTTGLTQPTIVLAVDKSVFDHPPRPRESEPFAAELVGLPSLHPLGRLDDLRNHLKQRERLLRFT